MYELIMTTLVLLIPLVYLISTIVKRKRKVFKDKQLEKLEFEKRINSLSQIENGSTILLPHKGFYRRTFIKNNDVDNQKMFLTFKDNTDKNLGSNVYSYDNEIFNNVETLNPRPKRKVTKAESINELKSQLKDAVDSQNYEEAERLKKKIDSLKNKS